MLSFKVAAVNALRKSKDTADHLALATIRESVKGRDLEVGNIVFNTLNGKAYPIANIERRVAHSLVTLDCPASVNGYQFTLDHSDRIDVYKA